MVQRNITFNHDINIIQKQVLYIFMMIWQYVNNFGVQIIHVFMYVGKSRELMVKTDPFIQYDLI